ncbi:MAG: hypothetical protein PUF12_00090 [Thermoflexaceae bacterium]|nr:hypothetical protein [Thermoflexaceae bacterium]
MINGCKDCLAYLIRCGNIEADTCRKCGQVTLRWKQNSFGTFNMECSNCGAIVGVDLNTPCELDATFQQKIKIVIEPHTQLPDNEAVINLGKLLRLNSHAMRKKLSEGDVIEVEHSELNIVTNLMKEKGIVFSVEQEEDMKEKYPFYKECKYPYSSMRGYWGV